MSWASAALLAFDIVLAVYASYSDMKRGVIPNSVLGCAFAVFSLAAVVYYGLLFPELAIPFLINLAMAWTVSIVLFYTKVWAGGDCKLLCVLAVAYPAELYVWLFNGNLTLFISSVFSLSVGWLYVVGKSVASTLTGKKTFDKSEFFTSISKFALSYLKTLVVVTAINGLFQIAGVPSMTVMPLVPLVCFALVFALNRFKLFDHAWILVAAASVLLIEIVVLGRAPFVSTPFAYACILIVAALRSFSAQGSYRTIATSQVREGMVLSLATTILLSQSRVKGLPGLSSEDLGSRLTASEAESVRRWETSAKGMPEVVIVEKIPFAPFVSVGLLVYLAVWSVC